MVVPGRRRPLRVVQLDDGEREPWIQARDADANNLRLEAWRQAETDADPARPIRHAAGRLCVVPPSHRDDFAALLAGRLANG
jgi:hypothetical protein